MITENIDYTKTFNKAYAHLDNVGKKGAAAYSMYKVLVWDVRARQVTSMLYYFVGFSRN